jgi:hypothetical protein
MRLNDKPTWMSVQSTNPLFIKRVEGEEVYLQELNRVTKELFNYLSEFHEEYCTDVTLTITMQESRTDQRLIRGMNEEGYIEPDFGKEFLGVYFKKVELIFTPKERITKAKIEFLIPYFHGLMVRYFAARPTAYSNWEFNQKFFDKQTYPKMRSYAAKVVNFPQIVSNIHQ